MSTMNSSATEAPELPLVPHVQPSPAWLAASTEPALEPALPIIDPHHHFSEHWGGYGLDELLGDAGSGHAIRQTVYIQCGWRARDTGPAALRALGETEAVVALAEQAEARGAPVKVAAGIVGHVDLLLGDEADAALAMHVEAGRGRFRGVRNSGARHPGFRHGVLARPIEGLYADPRFRRGYAALARHGLSFDAWIYHPQLDEVTALARAFPDTLLILDHFGGVLGAGPYAGRRAEALKEWRPALRALAACPNVVAKLGGMGTSVFGFDFAARPAPPSSQELAEAWRPLVEPTIEAFGAERCMFESNFPVDRGAAGYGVVWNAFKRLADGASAAEKAALFHDTAARVYRLDGAPPRR